MVVMMLMMIVAAAAVLLMVVMMLMMIMAAAAVLLMMVMMVRFLLQLLQLLCQGSIAFHSLQQLISGQLLPRCGYDGSLRIALTEQGDRPIQLLPVDAVRTGKDNSLGGFHLVIIKLAKITHIDLDLGGIYHRHRVSQCHLFTGKLLHCAHHIRQLAHTGRLDQDPVRGILLQHLLQCLTEIANQTAANTAGVHLRDLDACLLQKTAVNADLTKLIFDQHQLLTLVAFLDQFFDQRSFTCTQKAGINIDLCHDTHLL